MEDGRVGLLAAGADGRHDEVEIVQETVREQGILESVVKVGHNAELQTTVTQLLSRTTKEILMYHTWLMATSTLAVHHMYYFACHIIS